MHKQNARCASVYLALGVHLKCEIHMKNKKFNVEKYMLEKNLLYYHCEYWKIFAMKFKVNNHTTPYHAYFWVCSIIQEKIP